MVLGETRTRLREAFVVAFVCSMVVLVGVAVRQYAEDAGSIVVLLGVLGLLGYAIYVWKLRPIRG